MKRFSLMALSVLAVAALAPQVRADTIYSDNFDGTAGDLGGRPVTVSPGIDGGTAAATWNATASSANVTPITATGADAAWLATGGTHSVTGSTSATIGTLGTGADANLIANTTLPFTPQAGLLYDLHLAIESDSAGASGNWIGLGFSSNFNGHPTSGASSALSNDNTFGLMIVKGSGAVQSFAGLGTANQVLNLATGSIAAGSFVPFDVLLDTTGTQWKVSWLVNGVQQGTTFTYTTNPAIGLVTFGSNKLTGAVSDFSLTATPEPASLAMLGIGAMSLLARRRR